MPPKLKISTPEAPRVFDVDGHTDVWPIVAADAAQLAEEIAAGMHDRYLSLLAHVDRSHTGGRPEVQEAVRVRMGLE